MWLVDPVLESSGLECDVMESPMTAGTVLSSCRDTNTQQVYL